MVVKAQFFQFVNYVSDVSQSIIKQLFVVFSANCCKFEQSKENRFLICPKTDFFLNLPADKEIEQIIVKLVD